MGKSHYWSVFFLKVGYLLFDLQIFSIEFRYLGTINGSAYLDMMQNEAIPEMRQSQGDLPLFFQQDGAPTHYLRTIRAYLDQTFPNH